MLSTQVRPMSYYFNRNHITIPQFLQVHITTLSSPKNSFSYSIFLHFSAAQPSYRVKPPLMTVLCTPIKTNLSINHDS